MFAPAWRMNIVREIGRFRRRIATGKNGTFIPPVTDRGAAVAARKATNQRTAETKKTGQKIPGERGATPPARGVPNPQPRDPYEANLPKRRSAVFAYARRAAGYIPTAKPRTERLIASSRGSRARGRGGGGAAGGGGL